MSLKSTETHETILNDTSVIYTPLFVNELKSQNLTDEELHKKFKANKWLFGQLLVELQASYPCDTDINPTTRERDKDAFKIQFEKFFQHGRIFASEVQLAQCIDVFASSWSFAAIKQGKSFMCHYAKRPVFQKTSRSLITPVSQTSKNKTDPTLKEIIKCPFILRYSYVNKPRNINGCLSLFNVKITSSVSDHNCTLAPDKQRKALASGGKLGAIDLTSMQSIIERLKDRPHLSPIELRPMLEFFCLFTLV